MRRGLWGIALVLLAAGPARAEDPPDLSPPSVLIERPTERAVILQQPQANLAQPLSPVLIEGAAGDNVAMFAVTVRIYDVAGRPTTTLADCDGCGSKVVRWSVQANLVPGYYLAEARGYDTSGNIGVSNQRAFFVV